MTAAASGAVARVVHDLAGTIARDRLHTDALTRFAYGTDASFYRLTPQLVVRAWDEEEVVAVLRSAREHGVAVTFRAAGTSLSGQAITDALLLVLDGRSWRSYRIGPDGATITLQPGVIGAHANTVLAPYGRKIGPDPASIASAKPTPPAISSSYGPTWRAEHRVR